MHTLLSPRTHSASCYCLLLNELRTTCTFYSQITSALGWHELEMIWLHRELKGSKKNESAPPKTKRMLHLKKPIWELNSLKIKWSKSRFYWKKEEGKMYILKNVLCCKSLWLPSVRRTHHINVCTFKITYTPCFIPYNFYFSNSSFYFYLYV